MSGAVRLRIDVVTIFPEYLEPLALSLVGKAIDKAIIDLKVHDLRDWTHDRHRTVDDTPYGGGPGMVMGPEPWGEALDAIAARRAGAERPLLVIPTPSGIQFAQPIAEQWSSLPWLVIACGRYEGIDSRVAMHYAERRDWAGVAEVSIGDYVLAGGEAAALVIVEAVTRLVPGVLGNPQSAYEDSFSPGLAGGRVEGPMFTKPIEWRGLPVPEVLLSGHHGAIATWRAEQARQRTLANRPDLTERGP